MDTKRYSSYIKQLPLSAFLANASADSTSRIFATCISCRERSRSRRQTARLQLQPISQTVLSQPMPQSSQSSTISQLVSPQPISQANSP
jgi:hypothetical protein